MLLPVQVTSLLVLTLVHAKAEAPPGYVKPAEELDKKSPKYEYGYNIQDEKGTSHGKLETRDGIYALGRYYVQGIDSSQNVQYYADDWGYHPFIEYSNVGPHSRTKTQLLLGVEAVKALASNKFTPNSLPAKEHVTQIINSKTGNRDGKQASVPQLTQQVVVQQQPQSLLVQQPVQQVVLQQQPHQIVVEHQQQQVVGHQPQQVVAEQPQQVVIEHQQQQIVVGHQSQQVVAEQPQQVVLEHQPQQAVVEQPQQQVVVEHSQQITEQPQYLFVQQQQQQQHQQQQQIHQIPQILTEQLQQTPVEQSDSIVVEARGRQAEVQTGSQQETVQQHLNQENLVQQQGNSQQHIISSQQRLAQPQLEQVLSEQEVSYQQSQNVVQQNLPQPQLEQVQIREGISHQQFQQEQPQIYIQQLPEAQKLIQDSSKQIQDNLVFSQQSSFQGAKSNQRGLQQSQSILGGFGSKLNLLGRRKPNINVQIQQTSDRLIETTRNLVSGQDVLNINGAIDHSLETSIESSAAKSVPEISDQLNENTKISGTTTVTESSLLNEPIIVADFDEKVISSTKNYASLGQQTGEGLFSTTARIVETISTSFDGTEPSTFLVTPRPVSTDFLAPITAGIQLTNVDARIKLQNTESNQNVAAKADVNQKVESSAQKENYVVEVQKSLPYYLGKYEYVPSATGSIQESQSQSSSFREKAVENIELGKTLLALPGGEKEAQRNDLHLQHQFSHLTRQQLPELSIKENFIDIDQQQAQGIQHQVAVQQVNNPVVIEKVVEKQVPVPVVQTKIVEKPVEVTKYINTPYPVGVPVHIPVEVRVPVEKHIPVPVTVEKIVEKPVKVTEIVEKRVNVPQPYPVEKIIEKPVHIPVEVTKYVDRPYPVQVPVATPVPYPVDRVVEKIVKQPYPVEVRVPVEVKVPVPVEKIVEKKVPVPQYIEKQVDRVVEKPVPHFIDRPYPIQVQVPVPVAQIYTLQLSKTFPALRTPQLSQPSQKFSIAVNAKNYQQGLLKFQENTLLQSGVHIKDYLPPPTQQPQQNNGYLPPTHNCDQHNSYSSKNLYYTIQPDDYIGLLPPRLQDVGSKRFRNARSNFNSNLRLEYGFMPPLRPSQEIDEHGNPITREKP